MHSRVYPLHLAFAYLMTLTGLGAMATRWRYKTYHTLFGRAYVLSTMWCIASSILIHTHGAQVVIIISMSLLLAAITVGMAAITYHQRSKTAVIGDGTGYTEINTSDMTGGSCARYWRALVTAKHIHGVLFLFSWWCGTGRVITHKPMQWQRCYTQPALKMLSAEDIAGPVVYVDESNQDEALPPLFALYTLAPALAVIVLAFAALVFFQQRQKCVVRSP